MIYDSMFMNSKFVKLTSFMIRCSSVLKINSSQCMITVLSKRYFGHVSVELLSADAIRDMLNLEHFSNRLFLNGMALCSQPT